MAIKENDDYRIWLFKLTPEQLEHEFDQSLQPSIREKYQNILTNKTAQVEFMDYVGWPLMYAQGQFYIARSAAGNVEYRYQGHFEREIYKDHGFAGANIMAEYSNGNTFGIALVRLWLLIVELMHREKESGKQDDFWRGDTNSMIRRSYEKHLDR